MEHLLSNEDRLKQTLIEALAPLSKSSPEAHEHLVDSIETGFFGQHQSKGRIEAIAEEVLTRLMDSIKEGRQ